MSTVLVTGASGFIGSHLWETLVQEGFRVRCLVRQPAQAERCREGGAEPILGDATDLESVRRAVSGTDIVFNLAGLTHARTTVELVRVNQTGPRQVARACAEQATPPRHVLVSSVAASGPTAPDGVRRETDPPAPISNYGRSKLLGEEAAREWAAVVPTTVVRPGIVFGPRDRGMIPIMQSIARFRLHVNPGWRSPSLSFIEVCDLIEILLRAARQGEQLAPNRSADKSELSRSSELLESRLKRDESPSPESADPGDSFAEQSPSAGQGIYFGVAPERLRYAELGQVLGPVFHERGRVLTLHVPPVVAWTIGGFSQTMASLRGKSDLLNLDKIREAMVPSWACSAEKVASQLDFRPTRPLAEQLQETARWYRQQWNGS